MADAQFEDERWESLPLDLGLVFDADESLGGGEPCLQLPPGHHLVVQRYGRRLVARLAVDLPDIAEWNG
ncbi:hypothetical protein [Kitasatospora kifunensis]|uniref:Uncharacterized protein n=1 Tax=Kitasatospora kifunensis TaxID=58351 RepID=A0A7W7QYY3_KITKI|nr:hypothetical protein [Kitasatospora kifunensis]MBB4922175.1 hypothetical protein [Kitasatospora kifunensis]